MKFNLTLGFDFQLKVGSHIISVLFVEDNDAVFDNNEDDVIWGMWKFDEFKIYLKKNQPYSMMLSTFFHELFHCIEDIYGFTIKHQDLNVLAEITSQVLIENHEEKSV